MACAPESARKFDVADLFQFSLKFRVDKNDFKVTVQEGILNILGERKKETEENVVVC
jgi:hypothetical protein